MMRSQQRHKAGNETAAGSDHEWRGAKREKIGAGDRCSQIVEYWIMGSLIMKTLCTESCEINLFEIQGFSAVSKKGTNVGAADILRVFLHL